MNDGSYNPNPVMDSIPHQERQDALDEMKECRRMLISMGRLKYDPELDGCCVCGDPCCSNYKDLCSYHAYEWECGVY